MPRVGIRESGQGLSQRFENETQVESVFDLTFEIVHSSKEVVPGAKNQTKMANTGNPVLAFQIQFEQVKTGRKMVVSREIPIKVVSKKFWADYKEPLMPKFNMSIFMPTLSKVRVMVDKIKCLSKTVIVRANPEGTLQFRTKNAMQKISVNFHNLEKPVWEGEATPDEAEASVRIPTRLSTDHYS